MTKRNWYIFNEMEGHTAWTYEGHEKDFGSFWIAYSEERARGDWGFLPFTLHYQDGLGNNAMGFCTTLEQAQEAIDNGFRNIVIATWNTENKYHESTGSYAGEHWRFPNGFEVIEGDGIDWDGNPVPVTYMVCCGKVNNEIIRPQFFDTQTQAIDWVVRTIYQQPGVEQNDSGELF
jgi:hypothetical protein